MKSMIILRDNGDYDFVYGALLINNDDVETIKKAIENIMDEYYDGVIYDWDSNSLDYVLMKLNGKYEYIFVDNDEYILINKNKVHNAFI